METRKLFSNCVQIALENPDSRCLLYVERKKQRTISYREVIEAAFSVRDVLIEKEISKGSIVPMVFGHSDWVLTAFIGCVLHGCIPTVLPPLTSKQDPKIFRSSFQKLLERLQPTLILTREAVENSIPETDCPLFYIDELQPSQLDDSTLLQFLKEYESNDAEMLEGFDVAFLQHSSGTTGLKKGVMLTHEEIAVQIELYRKTIGLQAEDVIASWLPLYHDMGLICSFLMPLEVGATVIMLDPHEWVVRPTMLLDYIEKEKAIFAWLPNFAFHHMSRFDRRFQKRDLSHVRALISCSEPCRRHTFEMFYEKYKQVGLKPQALQVSYAMAENVFAVTQTDLQKDFRDSYSEAADLYLSCGKPLDGVGVEIRDKDTDELISDGGIGEIVIISPCLFSGYHKQPALSKSKIRDGRYYTSDLGTMKNGELYVLGRTDDLLIINGKNILAHEVEDVLNAIEGVVPGRTIVYSEYEERFGTDKLKILLEVEADIREEELKATIVAKVLSHTGVMVQRVEFVSRGFLVKSTSGKLAREASIQKYRNQGN